MTLGLKQFAMFVLGLLWLIVPAHADVMDDIQARGVLRIAVSEFTPWTFKGPSGEFEGFEIDVGRKLADELGVKPVFKAYAWEDIVGAVERGEADIIAAGFGITPARALRVEYSAPYTQSGATLVVNKKALSNVKSIEDVNKAKITVGVVAKTIEADLAGFYFDAAKIKTFVEAVSAEDELVKGQIQASIMSLPEARILVRRRPKAVAMPLSEPLVASVAGFAVKRGNQSLLNYLNAWIASHTADKWLGMTYDYWFTDYRWLGDGKKK